MIATVVVTGTVLMIVIAVKIESQDKYLERREIARVDGR